MGRGRTGRRMPGSWHGTRTRILKRDDYRCTLCGANRTDDPEVRLEVGHIIAAKDGGSDDDTNLQTECMSCNRGKEYEERAEAAQEPKRESAPKPESSEQTYKRIRAMFDGIEVSRGNAV